MLREIAWMMLAYLSPKKHRIKLWALLVVLVLIISLLTRIALLFKSFESVDVTFGNMAGIFGFGLFFDLINAIYFSLPLVLYLWLSSDRLYMKPWHRYLSIFWFFIFSAGLLFNAVAEFLFWDEFNVRYNFIAVDYLVYTNEVIGNINESYPTSWIIAGIAIGGVVTTFIISNTISSGVDKFAFSKRTKCAGIYALFLLISYFGVDNRLHHFNQNAYVNELAGNGLYELFAAYINNELDYHRFYQSVPETEALTLVHEMVTTPEVEWKGHEEGVERLISNEGPEKKLNVVLINVESFSAEFMDFFGNKKHITPFLDSLSRHSLVFTNLYATGTRTVRGLEALSLCVPPTPGQSIVRRPNNEHLFSLGKVFHDKGYNCEYIYGGYGYFDNMNYFFESNEYEVVDRTALNDKDIHYENVWGVADEDLFALAERQLDEAVKGRPVFAHVMTTSNHRPFTYPEGRIDIPSHSGRDGAVKYTDYAIGNFIKQVSKKEWFKNTIFIIVADHCASSAGKTELPVKKYHIPMLIYSPANVEPGVVNRLMSQIDIGPTVLGILNFSYTSKFFGYDIFKLEPGRERAFISTYQSLGYLKNKRLVILRPRKSIESYELSDDMQPVRTIDDKRLVQEAIAWYQAASFSFKNGLMKQTQLRSKPE